MSLTLEQLERLERVIASGEKSPEALLALSDVRSEIWQVSRSLTAADRALVRDAEAEGRVTVSKPYVVPSYLTRRMKPEAAKAKNGEELLDILGLNVEVYK